MTKNAKLLMASLYTAVIVAACSFSAFAIEITQKSIQTGNMGQNMSVTFQYEVTENDASSDLEYYAGIQVGSAYDDQYFDDEVLYGIFPFETPSEKNTVVKIGKLRKGTHQASVTMRLRRDITEGYYKVPVFISNEPEYSGYPTYIKIYVKKSSGGGEHETTAPQSRVTFELGEGQLTPYGVYPNVMDFAINLRNSGTIGAQDVKASMICEQSSTDFPFEINETNYDRHFDLIQSGETVQLPYSFAIRKDTYSGYYPIKVKITYRESSEGEILTSEQQFFVHIKGKEKEEPSTSSAFNANDRVKARIVVDSFRTNPEVIYAGQDFELVITMKNASADVEASNILFTFESEKVNNSPAFTTQTGSSSTVVNSLKGGESAELRMYFSAKAGIDPGAYGVNISEKYDSPEFKNAEEKVSIDIPVKAISKFGIGNIELLPESIEVGSEINVMFPVNNTGKTILYNTTVRFEADSINNSEIYLGNIKPGESANVDTMLKGIAATEDDGTVNVLVSYEDEYGEITTGEKTVTFYVYEAPADEIFEYIPEPQPEPEPPFYKKKWFIPAAAVAGVFLIIIITAIVKSVKKKKALAGEKL
ncbi:MAG: hypothetical protein MJ059_03360 [Lachnospiraceae bacterium]|nr:hypothetical protein [Lachnospiraceae bacterium]